MQQRLSSFHKAADPLHVFYIYHLFIHPSVCLHVIQFTCLHYIVLLCLDFVYCLCVIFFRIHGYMFTSTHVHSQFPIYMLFRYSLGCLIQEHMWITEQFCKHVYCHLYWYIYALNDYLARTRPFVCLLVEIRWTVRFEPFNGRSVLVLSLISFAGDLIFIVLRRSDVFLIYTL